jgi:Flp pilus assembly protein CpaB
VDVTGALPLAEPVQERVRSPRRWNIGALLSALLVVLCGLGALTTINRNAATEGVLVFARDVPPGAVLTAEDLRVEQQRLGAASYAVVVPDTEINRAIGKRLTEPGHAAAPLLRAQLVDGGGLAAGQVAMAIPVKPESAVGGRLREGDRVRVFGTTGKGQPESKTTVLLPQATVYAVGREQRAGTVGGFAGGTGQADANLGAITWIVLLVSDEEAETISNARWNGELDVVLLPPAASPATH